MRILSRYRMLPILGAGLLLAACASAPIGPTIAVMPAPGEPFDQFQRDDYTCRMYASRQIGVNPNQAAGSQVAAGAVAGTVVGAAAGALLSGGRAGGTQAGAATGLLIGTTAGAGNAQMTQYQLQWRYNVAYAQCMYANGAQVPGYAPQRYTPPPPPPGSPSPG